MASQGIGRWGIGEWGGEVTRPGVVSAALTMLGIHGMHRRGESKEGAVWPVELEGGV
jgi:hypothetical protein